MCPHHYTSRRSCNVVKIMQMWWLLCCHITDRNGGNCQTSIINLNMESVCVVTIYDDDAVCTSLNRPFA
eukprot:c24760_g4_i1 orf=331-537(-)